MFKNRTDAGMQLALKLKKFKDTGALIEAVPRGGVPVAYIVARELNCAMELILTKKIGHPLNKEYAIGAASLTDYFIIPHKEVSAAYVAEELAKVRARLKQMQSRFGVKNKSENLEGRIVLIVDDGIATGNTLLGTVQLLRSNNPSKLVIAVPVAASNAVLKLSKYVDEVIALTVPKAFYGVGAFYSNFDQVTDEEVMLCLQKISSLRNNS